MRLLDSNAYLYFRESLWRCPPTRADISPVFSSMEIVWPMASWRSFTGKLIATAPGWENPHHPEPEGREV